MIVINSIPVRHPPPPHEEPPLRSKLKAKRKNPKKLKK
jgi:hypothetical protein